MSDDPPQDEMYLDDTWTLWFHAPSDPDWTNSSYSQVSSVSSANNFWAIQSLIGDKITAGMFFLMREHVFPCWDDPHNAKGGCLSMKVGNESAPQFWEALCARTLTDKLIIPAAEDADGNDAGEAPDNQLYVNGLSVTPKNTFCVFKIWVGQGAPLDPDRYDIPPFSGQMMYRSHAACIVADAAATAVKTAPIISL
jgi:hypothetical protein